MENILLGKLFKKISIADSLKSIQSVFVLNRKLKYDPPYQREYVWHEVKATNFIETILWHGEVPAVVLYEKKDDSLEVIDGRQRCETIDRFIKGEFDLQTHGLDKLWYLSGKTFSQLEKKFEERIRGTKLRCIIVKAKDEDGLPANEEEKIKREVFKRYNMGMSALKKEEVYKAQYLHDEITIYLKGHIEKDKLLHNQVNNVFDYKSKNTETIMQHIRQLLVLSNIPINKYVVEREDIISKYYENYAYDLINKGEGEIEELLNNFKKKLYFLTEIKEILINENTWITDTLVVYDCIYWAISISEKEGISFNDINNKTFKSRLVKHIVKNVQSYSNYRSNYVQHIKYRYDLIATFFSSQLALSFTSYLKADREYLTTFRNHINQYMNERFGDKLKGDHFTQPTATSFTIEDIIDAMSRKKFNIRPPYQRKEVMKTSKASLLIESILLGIKLPPIYVFVRENGISEVIDGQQRLLAIISFRGKKYLDEHNKYIAAHKNNFTIKLASPLLPEINKKKFNQLPEELKSRILNYDLDVIEIKETENVNFKPEELFKRLNHKPFPLKEHTFEYWNAYVDSDLIDSIKDIYDRNKWLYIRTEDNRKRNQEMITCLCYLNLMLGMGTISMDRVKEVIDFYEYNSYIVIRIKNKGHISEILESPDQKGEFLLSLNRFESDFIEKMICLTENPKGRTTENFRNKRLDMILQTKGMRTPMRFFVLWLVLRGTPIQQLKDSRLTILNKISKVFSTLRVSGASAQFEKVLVETWVP